MTEKQSKPCLKPDCQELICRKPKQSDRQWQKQKYCSRTCAAKATRGKSPSIAPRDYSEW